MSTSSLFTMHAFDIDLMCMPLSHACVYNPPPPPQSGATRWRVVFAFEVELDFEAITDEQYLFHFIYFFFKCIYLFFEGCG